ncbi:hypothetical protein L218DRAFT_950597 [Marasmius fiardii PR-910]|nr:hypothetical protein L218DRAFT_950597 [Marasmius fiardii PR-910]
MRSQLLFPKTTLLRVTANLESILGGDPSIRRYDEVEGKTGLPRVHLQVVEDTVLEHDQDHGSHFLAASRNGRMGMTKKKGSEGEPKSSEEGKVMGQSETCNEPKYVIVMGASSSSACEVSPRMTERQVLASAGPDWVEKHLGSSANGMPKYQRMNIPEGGQLSIEACKAWYIEHWCTHIKPTSYYQ